MALKFPISTATNEIQGFWKRFERFLELRLGIYRDILTLIYRLTDILFKFNTFWQVLNIKNSQRENAFLISMSLFLWFEWWSNRIKLHRDICMIRCKTGIRKSAFKRFSIRDGMGAF